VALLLSDQRMPGMTGVEFLERAQEFYPHAKRVSGRLIRRAFTIT
jgi:thioredoxin reductase (NADPH)